MEISKGCKVILRRLLSKRIIGGKHLPENICLRWIKHLPKSEHRLALREWAMCIKEGLVMLKAKPSERHVHLNPERLNEVYELVK